GEDGQREYAPPGTPPAGRTDVWAVRDDEPVDVDRDEGREQRQSDHTTPPGQVTGEDLEHGEDQEDQPDGCHRPSPPGPGVDGMHRRLLRSAHWRPRPRRTSTTAATAKSVAQTETLSRGIHSGSGSVSPPRPSTSRPSVAG